MKVSYAMLTHNEDKELKKLLDFLIRYKDEEDEIVVLDDYSDNKKTIEILDFYVPKYDIIYEQRHLLKDFANQKNYLTRMCKGDYIINIDADEIPHKQLMLNMKTILESNPTIDLYYVPRVNTVDGLTEQHIKQWGWNVNDKGWVNFPDWQGRIWRNRPNIRWEKPVHERLVGFKEFTHLPAEKEYSFIHHKHIERQEKQNKFYGQIL
jgi:glycosyltransferase involved in cell wall biosynthesis